MLFIVSVLSCTGLFGQYDYFVYENGRFQTQMQVYVFTEKTALKVKPSVDAADVVSIAHCDKLLIVSNTMVENAQTGVIQYWYQAEYTNDSGKVFSGYINGHDLAIAAIQFQIDYRRDFLLFRISGFNPSEPYTITAKVVRNGEVLQTIRAPFIDFHQNQPQPDYSISALKNVQTRIDEKSEIAELSFFHNRSEFPAGTAYFIWNGENLARICETMTISEPELFEYDSWVVYPGREGVKPGNIMFVESIKEYDETSGQYVAVSRIVTTYIWDGIKISVLKEE